MRQPLPINVSSASVNQERGAASETNESPANYFCMKPLIDRFMILIMLTVALPLVALISVGILISDGRPIFFRQVRVGKQGRLFRIWKFRTMRHNAEHETGAIWSTESDPRVTRLGRWLRCSHLDELPQFFNILTGDMNLVGPRPERPEFVETLIHEVPNYAKRTQVSPGITGLAQLRLGYDESIAEIPKKVNCDLEYIRSASFFQDISLLTQTLPYIVTKIYRKWNSDPAPSSLLPPSHFRSVKEERSLRNGPQPILQIYRQSEPTFEKEVA